MKKICSEYEGHCNELIAYLGQKRLDFMQPNTRSPLSLKDTQTVEILYQASS